MIAAQCNDTAGEIKVIAKVYVDTNGLGQLLSDSGAVNSTDIVRDFMLGFAQAETSFDFIDVGHHSDQVRLKITG